MSREEILVLVKYRLEHARTALEDGLFLLEGGRSFIGRPAAARINLHE